MTECFEQVDRPQHFRDRWLLKSSDKLLNISVEKTDFHRDLIVPGSNLLHLYKVVDTGFGTARMSLFLQTKKASHVKKSLLVNHPPDMWNQILEELKQLYVLQTEEKRVPAFVE